MPVRRMSLSQRLLVGLVVVSFGYWAVIAWFTIRDSIDEVYVLFDAHLVNTATAVLRVADPDDMDPLELPNSAESPPLREIFSQWPELPERLAKINARDGASDSSHAIVPLPDPSGGGANSHALREEYQTKMRFQIWNNEGQLLLKSANAPNSAIADKEGFSESTDGEGKVWRHFGIWDDHRHVLIVVSEAHDVRNRLVRNIALHLVTPLVLGLPVLIFLLWISISRGLDPLGVLTREIENRNPESLMPLEAEVAPGEVRPMVRALNGLLQRVTRSLESERNFTANAAHELRTPLAAIQAQLHAARAADDETERERAMDQLQRAVERGNRVVGQLLTLARLDPEQSLPDAEIVNLGEIAENVCAELAPLALQRDQVLELQVESELPMMWGNPDMLSMLLSNLVDNSVRYTPSAGHIKVAISRHGEGMQMEVSDDGPGIPAAKRSWVFDRFCRIAPQDQPGHGLGLAICARIAELHDASITLADGPDGKGLKVSVFLPLAQVRG